MRKARKDTSTSYSEKHCAMKLDLLTIATVVDDAIRFVSEHQDRKIVEQQDNNNTQTTDKSNTTINQFFER